MTCSFTDAAGREWPLRITLGLLPRLRDHGVDVGMALDSVEKAVTAAFRDPDTIGRVLWTLVEPLARERGVSAEQLADAMDGPAMAGAVDAFTGAVVTFTRRPVAAKGVMELYAATMELATAREAAELAAVTARLSTSSGSAGGPPATGAGATPAT